MNKLEMKHIHLNTQEQEDPSDLNAATREERRRLPAGRCVRCLLFGAPPSGDAQLSLSCSNTPTLLLLDWLMRSTAPFWAEEAIGSTPTLPLGLSDGLIGGMCQPSSC